MSQVGKRFALVALALGGRAAADTFSPTTRRRSASPSILRIATCDARIVRGARPSSRRAA
ncbi:hypothetical protein D3C83_289690 [compost metagenome]